jgi:hypothetical protein
MKGMKKAVVFVIVTSLLTLFLTACDINVTTAHYEDLAVASQIDEQTNKPVTLSDEFNTQSEGFYVTGTIKNAPNGTVARIEWIYLDSEPEYLIDYSEYTVDGVNEYLVFTLSRPDSGWPTGSYEARLYIDGTLESTLPLTVKQD